MKILSPAGNMQSLQAAVCNGADEVYVGIAQFNARNNIDGFNMELLSDAVEYTHIHGVKLLLAVNILFSDLELPSVVKTVVDAYNLGVDAFIIQDIGLAKILHENYPQIVLHASTQMGLHNLEGVMAVKELGFKRVVLARETPLEEIKRIKNATDIEIEYFVQGALCVSFSGNCYLSAYLNDASGNRGRCKQLCRLPYTLMENGKKIKTGYLLSAKDFNMTSKLDKLQDAGVDVVKIEGRARRPYYVAAATREYYKALHGGTADQKNLQLAFNRGYTAGYFDGNGNVISNNQNHIGLSIGKVKKVNKGKTFTEFFVESNRDIPLKSVLKLFDGDLERCTLTAFDVKIQPNGLYRLTTTQPVEVNDTVRIIADGFLESEVLNCTKKRPLKVEICATEGQPIIATAIIDGKQVKVQGTELQSAKNQPLTVQNLVENFAKSQEFDAQVFADIKGNCFITKQALNSFRRDFFNAVKEQILSAFRHNVSYVEVKNTKALLSFTDFEIIEKVTDNFTAKNVVYSPEEYLLEEVESLLKKCKAQNKNLYLDTPNFALKSDVELLKNIIEKTGVGIVANNYYALTLTDNVVVGAGLNVYNKHSASWHNKPTLSAESDIATKVDFAYMTLRHCPMKAHLLANCNKCPYHNGFTYKMDSGKVLKLKRKKLSTCTFYLTD